LGLRQVDVGVRAGVSRSFASNLERGLSRSTDIGRIEAVCAALGADLDVRVRWRGEGLDRLLDEGHGDHRRSAGCAPQAWWLADLARGHVQRLRRSRLDRPLRLASRDAEPPHRGGEVGRARRTGTLAPLDRKVRVAPKIARERGLDPRSVSRLLVVGDTSTNRRRIARFEALFGAALPDRGWVVRRWLSKPSGSIAGLLFLPDSTGDGARRTTAGRSRVNRPRRAREPVG
jgi:transcriptional regulator with XRE-family HTH domain